MHGVSAGSAHRRHHTARRAAMRRCTKANARGSPAAGSQAPTGDGDGARRMARSCSGRLSECTQALCSKTTRTCDERSHAAEGAQTHTRGHARTRMHTRTHTRTYTDTRARARTIAYTNTRMHTHPQAHERAHERTHKYTHMNPHAPAQTHRSCLLIAARRRLAKFRCYAPQRVDLDGRSRHVTTSCDMRTGGPQCVLGSGRPL